MLAMAYTSLCFLILQHIRCNIFVLEICRAAVKLLNHTNENSTWTDYLGVLSLLKVFVAESKLSPMPLPLFTEKHYFPSRYIF